MTLKKRWSGLVLGSALALMLSSAVPTLANAVDDAPPAIEAPQVIDEEAPQQLEDEAPQPIEDEVPQHLEVEAQQHLEDEAQQQLEDEAPQPIEAPQSIASEAPPVIDEIPGAAARATTYKLSGTLTLPAGAAPAGASLLLVNAAYLKRWDAPGAVSHSATYNAQTGAWSVTNVAPGTYRLWFARGGHQLLPGKIVVTNKNLTGVNVAVPKVGQTWMGFFTPSKATNRIDTIVFRNTSTGQETSSSTALNGLGLATNPFTDLSAAGLCQAGGSGMLFWCPVLAPGQYTLHFTLSNGKTVYYNGHSGGNVRQAAAKGTTTVSKATKFNVQLLKSLSLQSVDLSSHFAASGSNAGTFTDVPKNHKFYADIEWLAGKKITTGVKQKNGTVKFLPSASVTREAMIAFLYRANGVTSYKPKGTSPFVDVKPGHQFYTQIMWAYETKVTTGIKLPNGQRKFAPKASITREAMAAFMYRQYGTQIPTGSSSARFTDVPANHKFAKEIKWMAANKITTGTKQPGGSVKFLPKGATSREATAAFLHRAARAAA